MPFFRFLFVAILSLALVAPCFAKSVTRARLITWPNPSKLGLPAVLLAEIDGLGGGPPRGVVTFTEGDTVLGSRPINPYGAGQATISSSMMHSCALTAAGGLACWGYNTMGQLGDGTKLNSRQSPVSVSGLARDVISVSAGYFHTCALIGGGAVKCWGSNYYGQLGDGTKTDRYVPVSVPSLSSGIVAIAAGSTHSCALTKNGAVKCWGGNVNGALGDRTTATRLAPVAVSGLSSGIVAIAAGERHSCALTKGGAVKCWGRNNHGQLGDGAGADSHAPVAALGLQRDVIAISVGVDHNCAIISGGAVKCWGANDWSQLGDGTTTDRHEAVAVPSLTGGAVAIMAADRHSCALTRDGAVKCWGANFSGQLGDGTNTDRHEAVVVSGLSDGAVAIIGGYEHSCALTRDGVVKCWGDNVVGQLGDGTTTPRLAPVTVSGFTALIRSRTWISTRTLGVGVHGLRASYHGDSFHGGSTATHGHVVVE